MNLAEIGLLGLGVMGRSLALNMERHGYRGAGYDRDPAQVNAFAEPHAGGTRIPCSSPQELLASLDRPRRILMMVPAGPPVDAAIAGLRGALAAGDLLIDGGNSYFTDTERRARELEADGILFLGTGISGGEQGALWGPSLMPGGARPAWELIRPVFEAISAKVGGEACVAYMGPRGAGHYVKMVHNGIEYGDMQLIAEAYDILHRGLGLSNARLGEVFAEWNRGELESYLVGITAEIFGRTDPETGQALLDLILDEAQQKGTGRWTSQDALVLGAPIPTIHAAVEGRILSAYREERLAASQVLRGPAAGIAGRKADIIRLVRDALFAAKICSYAQGFALMRLASAEYGFGLDLAEIARIWRGGCIIRARFLDDLRGAFGRDPHLTNLMLDPGFAAILNERQAALRRTVSLAAAAGIPTLALSASLAYYDAYRSARLPANLTQAQRDYFGAHTYRRLDRPGTFHTDWDEAARNLG